MDVHRERACGIALTILDGRLTGEMNADLNPVTLHEVSNGLALQDACAEDSSARRGPGDPEDLGAERCEPPRHVGSHEAGDPGDQHALPF